MSHVSAAASRFAADPASLPPELLEALLEDYRRTLRADFLPWCKHVLSPIGQEPARHHRLIIDELQGVAEGRTPRLMIFLPPGSAKSTYASVLFPPWFMARKRGMDVVAASHTVGLAEKFGRDARDHVAEYGAMMGCALQGDNTAAGSWRMQNGSRYYAVGVGGSLSGRRADLALIDDPINQDTDSDTQRENVWNWFNSVLMRRLKPEGRVVIIMTRWHEDDLAGRLLATDPDGWRVLKVPAMAEADDILGRALGEPLWSDGGYGYGAELAAIRDELDKKGALRIWSALYQQSPRPDSGALFKVEKIGAVSAAPAGLLSVRSWDLAATAQVGSRDPDWTVGLRLGLLDGRAVVEDVVRLRGGPEDVEKAIIATAQRDGKKVRVRLPLDPGQASRMQIAYLTAKLAGFNVESSAESGDKTERAMPIASQCNVGNLSMVEGPWNRVFIEELRDFPVGRHDDQVDALSAAYGLLAEPLPTPVRTARINVFAR